MTANAAAVAATARGRAAPASARAACDKRPSSRGFPGCVMRPMANRRARRQGPSHHATLETSKMPTVPLHPALVHVPLGLAFILPLVAAGIAFALWKGLLPRRSWLVLVVLQAVLVAGGAAALRTGEQEEDRVERVVGEAVLHEHEEAAEVFLWGAAIVLAGAAAVLVLPARAAAAGAFTVLAGTLVVTALAVRTGQAGGELVYRHGAASAYGAAPSGAVALPASGAHPGDDRDD